MMRSAEQGPKLESKDWNIQQNFRLFFEIRRT